MLKLTCATAIAVMVVFAGLNTADAANQSLYPGEKAKGSKSAHIPPGNRTTVSCRSLCVRKAAAPRPGDTRPRGYLFRVCTSNLTGQTVSQTPIVPSTPCR